MSTYPGNYGTQYIRSTLTIDNTIIGHEHFVLENLIIVHG